MEPFCNRSVCFLPITCILRLWRNDQRKTGQSSRRLLGAGDGLGEVQKSLEQQQFYAGLCLRGQGGTWGWLQTQRSMARNIWLHRKAFVAHFRSTVPRLHSTILNATNYIEIWCNDLSPWQELGHYLQTFQRLDAQSKGTASLRPAFLLSEMKEPWCSLHEKSIEKQSESQNKRSHVAGEILSFWNPFGTSFSMQPPSGIVGQEEGWGSLEESSHGGMPFVSPEFHVRKTIAEDLPDFTSAIQPSQYNFCSDVPLHM